MGEREYSPTAHSYIYIDLSISLYLYISLYLHRNVSLSLYAMLTNGQVQYVNNIKCVELIENVRTSSHTGTGTSTWTSKGISNRGTIGTERCVAEGRHIRAPGRGVPLPEGHRSILPRQTQQGLPSFLCVCCVCFGVCFEFVCV